LLKPRSQYINWKIDFGERIEGKRSMTLCHLVRGEMVGATEGEKVGFREIVGESEGGDVEDSRGKIGADVGEDEGDLEGKEEGDFVGDRDGFDEGLREGEGEGILVGRLVGSPLGMLVGSPLGTLLGSPLGRLVG
jgi:hypothetical protein